MRLKCLISYHYFRTRDLDALFATFPEPPEVFADSGAFSAMTQGVTIDVDEYAEWLQRWQHLFTIYANLDVIGDAETTEVNQRVLEDRYGLQPLPVFHVREDWTHYQRLLQTYPYIALGVAGHRSHDYMPWLVRCHQLARQADVRLHGFGITDFRAAAALPWYTLDSSSWGQGFRYGLILVWSDRQGRFLKLRMHDRREVYAHGELIRAHGFTPAQITDVPAPANRKQVAGICAVAYVKFERWLRRRHGLIPPPANGNGRPGGVRVYLVEGKAPSNLTDAADGLAGVRMYLAESHGEGKDARAAAMAVAPL
jgi:hypothetical protein